MLGIVFKINLFYVRGQKLQRQAFGTSKKKISSRLKQNHRVLSMAHYGVSFNAYHLCHIPYTRQTFLLFINCMWAYCAFSLADIPVESVKLIESCDTRAVDVLGKYNEQWRRNAELTPLLFEIYLLSVASSAFQVRIESYGCYLTHYLAFRRFYRNQPRRRS